ncbi:MAG TPA: polymorphic toxin-type HINT domain-containing protein [Pirellulales bacterium]
MRAFRFCVRCGLAVAIVGGACFAPFVQAAEPSATKTSAIKTSAANEGTATAAELVRQALQAEADGKLDERVELLHQAMQVDEQYAPAHWQLGEVRVGERWLPTDTAAAGNAWASKFLDYRKQVRQSAQTADAHLKVARWCEQAGMKDQEQMHLRIAMNLRPTKTQQRELLDKLGLMRYQKRFVPADQVASIKDRAKKADADFHKWKPILSRLCNDLESRDTARQASARERLVALQDVSTIPAMETVFAKSSATAGKAAIGALAAMRSQEATDSLVRHAVFATSEDVRKAAAEALKARDLFTYVPLLLSAMNTPIEVTFQVFGYEGGAFGERLSLYREGPLYNTAFNTGLTALPSYTPTPGRAAIPLTGAAEQNVAQRAAADSATAAAALAENVRTEFMNERIGATLRVTTGDDSLGDDAKEWWNWWTDYNETHRSSDKPTYETNRFAYTYYSAMYVVPRQTSILHNAPPPEKPWHRDRGAVACFVPGTKVWTVTGTVPIETIRMGDWVLAQNVDTGELAYKPVMATTVGPSLPLVEIHAGQETIRCTLGHLFWISGTGWRMAKELKTGDRLHTTKGTLLIDSVEQTGESACHNLIVPEFNTYFVTDQQILVHDINFRGPTMATVPGLAKP